MYCIHRIQKKNGGVRVLEEPSPILREEQKRILELLRKYRMPPYIHGVKSTSTTTNSSNHISKPILFRVDISNFFPSIKTGRIIDTLERYTDIFSIISRDRVEEACTFRGRLPTGAITSPLLANISFIPVDNDILLLLKDKPITYTRYMDDLSFSSEDRKLLGFSIRKEIIDIIRKYGFSINWKKTGYSLSNQQQKVTGIVVNNKLNIDRKYKLLLRAELDHLARANRPIDKSIAGKLAHIRSVNVKLAAGMVAYYHRRVSKYHEIHKV